MSAPGGPEPLSYRRIGRAEIGVIALLHLEPGQSEQFLGPVEDIEAAVRGGPAHAAFGIDADGRMVGFYVLHPDRRDASCWWLGWLALDRRQQGRGYGRRAMAHIMRNLRGIARCRRARLLVNRGNAPALRLYRDAGFHEIGVHPTGELVLEAALWVFDPAAGSLGPAILSSAPKRLRRKGRVRRPHGPHAAFCIGVTRGPPSPCRHGTPALIQGAQLSPAAAA